MKYLLGKRTTVEWSAQEREIIEQAIYFVQHPPVEPCFEALALFLHRATNADYVTVGVTTSQDKKYIRTLAFTHKDQVLENITYCTVGAPCENVLGHNFCYYPSGIQQLFPEDEYLRIINVHCYMGVPLNDQEDNTIGLLSLLHHAELPNPHLAEHLLFIMAGLLEELLNCPGTVDDQALM